MSLFERARINRSGRAALPSVLDLLTGGHLQRAEPCAALDGDGQCGVYDLRPVICRLWGASEAMPCPFGCRPAAGLLSHEETQRILLAANEIGGLDPDAEALAVALQTRLPATARRPAPGADAFPRAPRR